ncbi:MAG: hypothetical protein J7L88_05240 [Thermoplasmata archaeon]|nr:hypothetical protein [Thermoplasmata archaeon]
MKHQILAVVFILTVAALYVPSGTGGTRAEEDLHPLSLYLHQDNVLNTLPPQKTVPSVSTLSEGDTLDFTLSYPLTSDMTLRGYELTPGVYGVRLLLEATGGIVESSARLSATLYVVKGSQETPIANGTFTGSQISEQLKPMPFSGGGVEVQLTEGSLLRLRLKAEKVQSPYRITVTYDSTAARGRLEFAGDNLISDDILLKILDRDGKETSEIEPNLPSDMRRVTFQITASDSFGVYDLAQLNITVSDTGGTDYLEHQFSDFPSSGDGSYTYNYTWDYPANIPAGTLTITIQIVDQSGYEALKNFTLEVAPCGVYLSADVTEGSGAPGETVSYEVSVLNTGAESCKRTLEVESMSGGWSASCTPTSLTLGGGESDTVTVSVSIPSSASGGDVATTVVTGRTTGGKVSTIVLTTEVVSTGGFIFTLVGENERSIQPTEYTVFSLNVTNTGSATDTFHVYTDSAPPLGWNITLEGGSSDFPGHVVGRSATISPGRVETFYFTVEVGSDFESTSYSAVLKCYPESQGEGSARSITLTVTISGGGGKILQIDPGDKVQTSQVTSTSGGSLRYSEAVFIFEVHNYGSETWTVDLQATVPSGWEVNMRDSVSVAAGESERVSLGVTPSPTTLANEDSGYMITLSASVREEPDVVDALQLWVKVAEYHKVTVTSELENVEGVEGETLTLNITIKNTGNTEENVNLQVTLPEDSHLNVTLSRYTLRLSPSESATVQVRAEVEGKIKESVTETVRITGYYGEDSSSSVDITFTFKPSRAPSPSGAVVWIVLMAVVVAIAIFFFTKPKAGAGREGGGEEEGPEARETLAGVHM